MEKENLLNIVRGFGLSEKASRVYLASLELGEATVLTLAKHSGVKRSSLYYVLEELKDAGALIQTKRNKKVYFLPAEPKHLLRNAHEKIVDTEKSLNLLEIKKYDIYKKPRVYFLYGPQGFRQIWDMIFDLPTKEFRIITEGVNFLDFVKEKYIIDDIIQMKKKLGIKSKQLIVDSEYAREIVAKDSKENRLSKLIPHHVKLPFTEVITDKFVAFISPRWDNTLFVVQNESFAQTRISNFELLWDVLPKRSIKK